MQNSLAPIRVPGYKTVSNSLDPPHHKPRPENMAKGIKAWHWVVIVLSFIYFRQKRGLKQLVAPPTLPPAYSASGDVNSTCRVIRHLTVSERLKYCEDISVWEYAGQHSTDKGSRLLLSCDPGRKEWNTVMGPLRNPDPRGDIWIFNPHEPSPSNLPQRVVLEGFPDNADFHPLGAHAIQIAPGKESHLFVVNHQRHNTTIELFILPLLSSQHHVPMVAKHVKTLTHPAFVSPNAVAPISPTSFFVTNDHYMTRRLPWPFGEILPMVETLLALPLGWVDKVDLDLSTWKITGNADDIKLQVTTAVKHIPFANGVAVSQDGKELAVASSTTLEVFTYGISQDANTLTHKSTIPVPFHPDNLSYGKNGSIYLAGHPSFPLVTKIVRGLLEKEAPSWVVSLIPGGYTEGRSEEARLRELGVVPVGLKPSSHGIKTLYQSDGVDGFATSTTAVVFDGGAKMFVGGLYETGVLECSSKVPFS